VKKPLSRPLRLSLVVLLTLVLLGSAGSDVRAVAARPAPSWDPEFLVQGNGRSSYRIALYDRAKRDYEFAVETEQWEVYVPRGFQINTRLPVGARIGVSYGAAGVLGDVVVADPAVASTRPCLRGLHDALWRLPTQTSSSPDGEILVAVDRITGAAEARFAAYRLTACPPAAAGDAELDFQIDVMTSPAARGDYVWRAVFYPTSYTGAAVPQAVEARSLVRLPIRVALSAKRFTATAIVGATPTRQRKVLITGRVTENGKPPVQGRLGDREGRYSVSLYRRTTKHGRDQYLGDLGVGTSGRFRVVVRDRRGIYYRVTTVDRSFPTGRTAPPRLCDPPWLAPGGCVRPNLWDFFVDSPIVRAA
jgi:hypothetical protein